MACNLILIYCPFPSRDAARVACRALLEARLIACGNILPMGESHYWWQGALTQAEECILIAKTAPDMTQHVTQKLLSLHPYECPAILSVSAAANPTFAAWVMAALDDTILSAASD